MRSQPKQTITGLAMLAVDLAALATWTPDWPALHRHLGDPHAWVSGAGADRAALILTAAALWCWGVWVGIGLVCAVASALPGRPGSIGAMMARRSLPAALRRLVVGTVGVGLAVSPLLPLTVATASPSSASGPAVVATTAAPTPQITWPSDPTPTPPVTVGWPTDPTPPAPGPVIAAPASGADTVTVRPGDCLWMIAAHRLGPGATDEQIATAWPQWYRANATTIGSDPNQIRPGQHLVPPATKGSSS